VASEHATKQINRAVGYREFPGAAPHLSLLPERLQLSLRAPSVVGKADALQIRLCQWFL